MSGGLLNDEQSLAQVLRDAYWSLKNIRDDFSEIAENLKSDLNAQSQTLKKYVELEQAKILLNEGNLDANQRNSLIELITKDLKEKLPQKTQMPTMQSTTDALDFKSSHSEFFVTTTTPEGYVPIRKKTEYPDSGLQ